MDTLSSTLRFTRVSARRAPLFLAPPPSACATQAGGARLYFAFRPALIR